jgi:hypothetical protein
VEIDLRQASTVADKTAAREQAMKHFGLYERDNNQKPFCVPPVIQVVLVPGRGQQQPEERSINRPPAVRMIPLEPGK